MVQIRKDPFVVGEMYHVFTKSIADYVIFNVQGEYQHMQDLMLYYLAVNPQVRYSWIPRFEQEKQKWQASTFHQGPRLVQVVAFVLMPTHIHFLLKQLFNDGISIYMGRILNSYTRYFNLRHKRKGPLWEGRFKGLLVKTDEQALHLTRYLHLNPTTAGLVARPEDWKYSSFKEYIYGSIDQIPSICDFKDFFNITKESYKDFVEVRQDYQRSLAQIRHLLEDG